MKLTLKHEKDNDDLSVSEGTVLFEVSSDVSEKIVYLEIGVECEKRYIEFSFGPEYGPTYVPYGNTSVMYEPGGADLEEVDASSAVTAEHERTLDEQDDEITTLKACEMLECSYATFNKCIKDAEDMAEDIMQAFVEKYYLDNPDEASDE